MKKIFLAAVFAATAIGAQAQPVFPRSQAEDTKGYMSEAYWKLWSPEEQARIDADIEKYRKADGELVLENIGRKRDVKIEQISHEFVFGAHIFNFNQLGSKERNDRYKELFGTLFNRATIPFYWREFELEQGKPRFATEYRDTEEFWNNCKARFALLQLKLLPIERDGCRVKQFAIEALVALVILALAQLVEVEDMRAKDKLVRNLLNLHIALATNIFEYQLAIGLAILLDVGIDASLLLCVPNLPIRLAHITLCILGLRAWEYGLSLCAYCCSG